MTTKQERLAAYEKGQWADTFTPRAPGEKRYWLVKSEPTTYSFDDLLKAPRKTTQWDGIRNHVARNFMRDAMQVGDRVFFYHSSTDPQAIVGICEVAREGYPDSTAPSEGDEPTWFMVDLRAVEKLARPVTLAEIKKRPELAKMAMLRIGRLSVSPVTKQEWDVICGMAAT